MEDKAKEYTEKQYYKVDDIDEFNGEPLAVYRAYKQCQEDMADKKYTEEDIKKAFMAGCQSERRFSRRIDELDKYINSLNKQD
jgi:hypothetical protein